jgi:hypothetical protein
MVGQGNRGYQTGYGKVSKLCYINEKFVYGSICNELPPEKSEMSQHYIIHLSENMSFSCSEIDTPQSFWIQLSVNEASTICCDVSMLNGIQFAHCDP